MADFKATVKADRRGAPAYHIVDDLLPGRPANQRERDAAAEDLSVSPYWIVAVARGGSPSTASRKYLTTRDESCSHDTLPSRGVEARGPLLVLDSGEAVDVSTSHGKRSYLAQLQATIVDVGVDMEAACVPGDWILCWMLQSEEQGLALKKRIHDLKPCNGFHDGLKFVGRVHDIRRRRRRDPQSGTLTSHYTLTGVGFGEFQAKAFFDPHLAESSRGIGTFLSKIGTDLMGLLREPRQGGSTAAIDTNAAIPKLFEIFLGSGISRRAANPSETQPELRIGTGLTAPKPSDEAPYAYLVPEEVGRLLGKIGRSKRSGILAYADLCELLIGVQKFNSAAGTTQGTSAPWSVFVPDGIEPPPAGQTQVPQHKHTGRDVLGQFIPTPPDFSNKPVWTILEQYLNPVVNEMYAALRANEAGCVVPTVVVRQSP